MSWIWFFLILLGTAFGFYIGKEIMDAKYQRALHEAEENKNYWKDIACKQSNGKPPIPPDHWRLMAKKLADALLRALTWIPTTKSAGYNSTGREECEKVLVEYRALEAKIV